MNEVKRWQDSEVTLPLMSHDLHYLSKVLSLLILCGLHTHKYPPASSSHPSTRNTILPRSLLARLPILALLTYPFIRKSFHKLHPGFGKWSLPTSTSSHVRDPSSHVPSLTGNHSVRSRQTQISQSSNRTHKTLCHHMPRRQRLKEEQERTGHLYR